MASKARRWVATAANTPERLGIAFIRIMVGVIFVMHGYQKWFIWKPSGTVDKFSRYMHMNATEAYAAMSAELVCGTLLVLGLFTRLAAIPIVVTMAVAVIAVHLPNGFFLGEKLGYEYALTLGVAALGLVFTGPGLLAADNLLA